MNKKYFEHKTILFIGPVMFQYHTIIYEELIKMGAEVDFFGENTLSLLYRILKNINKKLFAKYVDFIRNNIWTKVNTKHYDYIFLIRGDLLTNEFLMAIKQQQPQARFIMYQWDSVQVFNYLDLIDQFDVVFSFDSADCEKFGFRYLPLFYDNDYSNLRNKYTLNKIDLLFIGTLHSDRLKILKALDTQVKECNLTAEFYFYMPFFTFLKNVLLNKSFEYDMNYLIFKSFNKSKILNLLAQSKAVVDINNTLQTGLTMRTIETLGAGKKLITTNGLIQKEIFFNKNDIQILDRDNPIINIDFLQGKNSGYSYTELNIQNWIKTIFGRA